MAGELVLIVEDNPGNMKLARDVLEFHGFRTAGAETAARALELVAGERPRLVLLDVQLPDMDGPTLLAHLRADRALSGVAIVAVTAFAMAGDRERFLEAGFDGYLAKPIDVKSFPEHVRRFCEGRP